MVDDVFIEALGRRVLPRGLKLNEVDEPAVLDCGFGKGAWLERILGEFGTEVLVRTPVILICRTSTT